MQHQNDITALVRYDMIFDKMEKHISRVENVNIPAYISSHVNIQMTAQML